MKDDLNDRKYLNYFTKWDGEQMNLMKKTHFSEENYDL